MTLSYDELHEIFENLGFRDFTLRESTPELHRLLSCAAEDNEKAYLIDVVPGGLEDGLNDGIALMEKHYFNPVNERRLAEKWKEILLYFMCYYPLESVFVTGMGLTDDEELWERTPNQDGYQLEVSMSGISDLDEFLDLVWEKTYATPIFWFASLGMVFYFDQSDVYMIVALKKITPETDAAIALLRKLVEAQGLFLV